MHMVMSLMKQNKNVKYCQLLFTEANPCLLVFFRFLFYVYLQQQKFDQLCANADLYGLVEVF